MSGALLRSGALKEFFALGAVGHPVYQSAAQLRIAMRNQIGADVADTFAVPKRNDTGDMIDWYAPLDGPVIPWTSATAEEKASALQALQSLRERVLDAGQRMQGEHDSERQVFGRLLAHVMSFPDDQHVYLVNGKPVLTFWGFRRHDIPSSADSLALLAVDPVVREDETAPAAAPVSNSVVTRRFPWWLWPLLLLLLLLLLLFWFRSCSEVPPVVVPGLESPAVPEGTVPLDPVDRVGVRPIDERAGAVVGDRDGAMLPTPGGDLPAGDVVTGEPPVPPEVPDEADQPPAGETPPEVPEPPPEEVPPGPEEAPPELPPQQDPDQPPGPDTGEPPPLQVPPEALQQGNVDFLNGRWNSNSGLIDETGRPVQLEYDFKDGKGQVSLKRSDGSVCQGTAKASISKSQLVIADQNQITCPDGQVFQSSTVDCSVGDGGRAECKGKYATGGNFPVEIRQAQ